VLSHTFLAFTYKLKEEADLIFKMLTTMDGNDSLKHILHYQLLASLVEGGLELEEPQVGDSRELPDHRKVGGLSSFQGEGQPVGKGNSSRNVANARICEFILLAQTNSYSHFWNREITVKRILALATGRI